MSEQLTATLEPIRGYKMKKKTLEEYMSLPYRMEIIPDQNGMYTLHFPDLPGCVTTGTSLEDVVKNAEDAKECWLRACLEDGHEIPLPTDYSTITNKEFSQMTDDLCDEYKDAFQVLADDLGGSED